MVLGERVKFVRKSNKLNQADFAKRLGISQTHVSKIEKNVENPSETLLKLISIEFGISEEWLKTGAGEMVIDERLPLIVDKSFLNVKVKELKEDIEYLLSSDSNFEYGVYAYSLNLFTMLFRTFEKRLSKEQYLDYIQQIETITGNFFFVCLDMYYNEKNSNAKKEELLDTINKLFLFLECNGDCRSDRKNSENA
ncbi:MAG: helix-turn-helix transcriptional regulator [Oscillospiraceae bacterium]|nr:helix-turn-helix transcriptional regulator [Oscillospiraceae bacterium]